MKLLEMHRRFLCAAAIAPVCAWAATPDVNDYARGAVIDAIAAPMVEVTLPDEVYRHVTRPDLRDVRVFNADGGAVPHAFCTPAPPAPPKITQHTLRVFELRTPPIGATDRAQVHVALQGASVSIQGAASEGSVRRRMNSESASAGALQPVPAVQVEPHRGVHIIDAGMGRPVRAVQFDWSSPDDASQARVRIESSDDLNRWDVVVPESTLLHVSSGAEELRRERIELPERTYKYLRVQRVDGGPPLLIKSVTGERLTPSPEIEPQWFTPDVLQSAEPNVLLLDANRLAPVQFARLRLQQANSSVNVRLQSRGAADAPWRDRWSGEVWSIATGAERRESPPARFEPTADRYWRIVLPQEAASSPSPLLELGYRPQRLRFMAQGAGPFTLAFGSRRAEPATPASCDGLLTGVSASDRDRIIGQRVPQRYVSLGGERALRAAPRQTPVRTVVLWSVLVIGVAVLSGMALSLLNRIRPEERSG